MKVLITPLTIGSFLLMAITGISLFFHIDAGLNHLVHEWLGWLFLLAVILHVAYLHAKSFKSYFRQLPAQFIIAGAALLTVLTFVAPARQGVPPFVLAEQALYRADLELSQQVLNLSDEALQARLQQLGIAYAGSEKSLEVIAQRNGLSQKEIMAGILGS